MPTPNDNIYSITTGGTVYGGYYPGTPKKYLYQEDTILYDAPVGTTVVSQLCYTPARASVPLPTVDYLWSGRGPNYKYVETATQWSWTNLGGDWKDINGVDQGSAACWSFLANSVPTGAFTYNVDVTAALIYMQTTSLWNAWIVRCSVNRSWATRSSNTPPYMSVIYTDLTTGVLLCTASAELRSGTGYSRVGIPSALLWTMNGVMEFEKPAKPIQSGTLVLTIDTHTSTSATINGFLMNPPINSAPVTTGIAVNYPLDASIGSNPSVSFAARFQDGSVLSDFIANDGKTSNVRYSSEWSPHIFNNGPIDTTKLPFAYRGEQLNGRMIAGLGARFPGSSNFLAYPPEVISSSYRGEGFYPIAPGIGALKITIPGNNAEDGAIVGTSGAAGADLFTFLPDAEIGLIDELYVRYNVLFGTYPEQRIDQTKMFRNYSDSAAAYMQPRGKMGPAPHAVTSYGGNNRTGGGNTGWSSRYGYENWADMDPNSVQFYLHSLDMLPQSAPGTKSGNVYAGQQGGIGTRLLRGIWYDIECRLKLNTWTTDGSDTTDAVYQMWIDGKLAVDFTGFSFRKGPLNYDTNVSSGRMGYTPLLPNALPPFREIGHFGIWLNDYQGGVTSCEFNQYNFYTGIVVSKTRIGPMRL